MSAPANQTSSGLFFTVFCLNVLSCFLNIMGWDMQVDQLASLTTTEFWTVVIGVANSLTVLCAIIAVVVAIFTSIKQSRLTESIHKEQRLFAQRQMLIPIWGVISNLNDIDPSKPVWPDVIKAMNTLELVALCWEGQLIDKHIIRRTFRLGCPKTASTV